MHTSFSRIFIFILGDDINNALSISWSHFARLRSLYFVTIFIIGSNLSWKYSMGQKNGLHAFGYNSAQSEPIWMKSRTMLDKCCGLALADSGSDPSSSDSLRGSRNFVFFCLANNAGFRRRFPVQNISTQQRRSVKRWKLLEHNFENFIIRVFSPKNPAKLLTKFSGFATSGRQNSATITDRRKFTSKWSPYGMSSFHFCRSNHFKVFPLCCTLRIRKVLTQIFGNVRCPILRIQTFSTLQCWCGLVSDILNKNGITDTLHSFHWLCAP